MNMPLSMFMIYMYIDICMKKGAKLLNQKLRQKHLAILAL